MRRPAVRLALGLVAFVLIGWASGALLISVAGSSEAELMRDLAREHSAALTAAARAVTWAGSAIVLVPLAALCCLLLLREGLRREALAVAVSLAGAIVIYDSVKLLVARPRPPVEHLQAVSSWSFPSGHATQASALWSSLVLVLPALGATPAVRRFAAGSAVMLVIAVALSRV
ncbi:MAG TPA: phosphatase PAP2 family protein, partial [Solirubrobacteraceae bacterium]